MDINTDPQELEQALYLVAKYAFEHSEMLKSFVLLQNAPAPIKDAPKIKELYERVTKRLDEISHFQTYGRENSGWNEPFNLYQKTAYVELRKKLDKHPEVRHLVDVGCFSGWVGRDLALWGYRVHGVDLDSDTLRHARYLASGTPATFEVCSAEQLGVKHPQQFDGAICFDVLEHVFDLPHALQSIENSLKEGGWVFINMPKSDRELIQEDVPDEVREHINVFDEEKVNEIFGGKKNVKIEVVQNEDGKPDWSIEYQV